MEKTYNVLLVDDEENILSSLRRLFRKEPYTIKLANSAEEGLELLNLGENFQLIISDYRMTGKNGVEFLKEAKQICPESIRMVLSGYADITAILDAINEGEIYKFMTKPWNDDDLKVTVRRAIEQYELARENRQLNKELKELNQDLEAKVEERTMELQLRNRALINSQEIMELLPFSVIGVDREGTLTLVNRKGAELFPESKFSLGDKIDTCLPPDIVALVKKINPVNGEMDIKELKINGRRFHSKFALLGKGDEARGYILTFLESDVQL